MSYLVFKNDSRREFRLYVDGSEYEGQIIYKGHKLSLEANLLSQLIDYRIERSTNKVFYLQYDKITEGVSHLDKNIWKTSTSESFEKSIMDSWESMQRALEIKVGKFRKILITAVNI
jgi:hypothetical protein